MIDTDILAITIFSININYSFMVFRNFEILKNFSSLLYLKT